MDRSPLKLGFPATLVVLAVLASFGAARVASSTAADLARVARGFQIFFNETFGGNGRTCGTCHPATNNFTLDPSFIAALPASDPLFVAEFNPALAGLEDPVRLRQFALIRENADGFDKPAVLRGVPHTLALATSVASPAGPRTGWSGDAAPDASLRQFTVGAIVQHFPRTLNRQPGVDFRLPTDEELDAVEAFILFLGRQADPLLPLPLKGSSANLGQTLFLDNDRGRCNLCHVNAGASSNLGNGSLGNANFDTGIRRLSRPAAAAGSPMPPDGGFGQAARPDPAEGFGDGTFNVPPLVEAADTPPFFSNNAFQTIEEAVAFYTSAEFNTSPARDLVGPIRLTIDEANAIAAFLRVINALENIRSAIQFERLALTLADSTAAAPLLVLARRDFEDAIKVLQDKGLHPEAIPLLEAARFAQTLCGAANAIVSAKVARALLVDPEVDEDPVDTVACPTITNPTPDRPLSRGTRVTFTWTEVPGAGAYGFEFTGKDRRFANPNGLTVDGVNGFDGAGGGFLATGTRLTVDLPTALDPGIYEVRVIPLSASGFPVGRFSDAISLVVE